MRSQYTKNLKERPICKKDVKPRINEMLDINITYIFFFGFLKKDASGKQEWRIVIAYKHLNEILVVNNSYPLQNINRFVICLIFSSSDLASEKNVFRRT